MPGFQQVAVEEDTAAQVVQHPSAAQATNVSAHMLAIALKALGQRAVVALSSLFTSMLVLSAWWLWLQAPAEPSVRQLVGLGLYGLFVLAVLVIRGRA